MNIPCELFSNLPDVVLLSIFSFIRDEDILILAEVSKSLRQLISSIDWGVYIMTRPKRTSIMHNFSIDPFRSFEFFSPLLKTFVNGKIHKCLAPIVNGNAFHHLPITAICASSTDYDQIIENVTRDDEVSSFWSSLGHNTTECEEFAIFELKEFAIIKKIKIDFFRSFQGVFYPCEFINIELGLSCVFDFKTRNYRIPANQISVVLDLDVNFSVCRFIKLNFINKIRIQDEDNKYYIAIQKISFEGISFNIKEIMKIESGYDEFRGLFRSGIENYYKNKAVKFSENKTNIVKYLDVKYNCHFDNESRTQYFKEKLKNFQDQQDLNGFFKIVEENPDFMRQKWFFELLEQKKEFFELYFKNLDLKKNRIYINVEELECHFSYYFLSKTETLSKLVDDTMSCFAYDRFLSVFKNHFGEFNASLEKFDYFMVTREFFLNLAFKIKEIAFSNKITTNELIDQFIKKHTPGKDVFFFKFNKTYF